MVDDPELQSFIVFVKGEAMRIDGISKKEVRSKPEFHRLRKKYKNMDDLVVTIYNQVDVMHLFLAWIKEAWKIRRLETMYETRTDTDYLFEATVLIRRFVKVYPTFFDRISFKYVESSILKMVSDEIKTNPWRFVDVVKASDLAMNTERREGFYEKLEEREAAYKSVNIS